MRLALALLIATLPASAVAADKILRPAPSAVAQKCSPVGPRAVRGPRLIRPERMELPVSLERAVWRKVEGCPVRVIVSHDVGRATDRTPTSR